MFNVLLIRKKKDPLTFSLPDSHDFG